MFIFGIQIHQIINTSTQGLLMTLPREVGLLKAIRGAIFADFQDIILPADLKIAASTFFYCYYFFPELMKHLLIFSTMYWEKFCFAHFATDFRTKLNLVNAIITVQQLRSQDNVIGITFHICHNDKQVEFSRIKFNIVYIKSVYWSYYLHVNTQLFVVFCICSGSVHHFCKKLARYG